MKISLKIIKSLVLIIFCVSFVSCGKTVVNEDVNITLVSSKANSEVYNLGSDIALIIEDNTDFITMEINESASVIENVSLVGNKTYQMGIAPVNYVYEAITNSGDFLEAANLSVLFVIDSNNLYILTNNPQIKSVSDLGGKNIGVGTSNSRSELIFKDLQKVGLIGEVTPINNNNENMIRLFQRSELDAILFYSKEIPEIGGANVVGFTDEETIKLQSIYPFYSQVDIQDKKTIGISNVLFSNEEIKDNVGYEITKAVYAVKPEINGNIGKMNLNKGSLKFFEELKK